MPDHLQSPRSADRYLLYLLASLKQISKTKAHRCHFGSCSKLSRVGTYWLYLSLGNAEVCPNFSREADVHD